MNVQSTSATKFRIAPSASFTASAVFTGPSGEATSKAAVGITITFPNGKVHKLSFTEVLGSEVFNPRDIPMSVGQLEVWVDRNLKAEYYVREIPTGSITFEAFIAGKGDIPRYNASTSVNYMTFDPQFLSGEDADALKIMFR